MYGQKPWTVDDMVLLMCIQLQLNSFRCVAQAESMSTKLMHATALADSHMSVKQAYNSTE